MNNQLVNSDEVNLGVKVINENTKETTTISFDDIDINVCPICKSENIEFQDIETEDVFAYRMNKCECGCEWEERYELTQVRILKK